MGIAETIHLLEAVAVVVTIATALYKFGRSSGEARVALQSVKRGQSKLEDRFEEHARHDAEQFLALNRDVARVLGAVDQANHQ